MMFSQISMGMSLEMEWERERPLSMEDLGRSGEPSKGYAGQQEPSVETLEIRHTCTYPAPRPGAPITNGSTTQFT